MKIDRQSLTFRLVVAILSTSIGVAALVFVLGTQIIRDVIEDYHHLNASYHTSETRQLFTESLEKLTSARILDNQQVTETLQQSLLDSLRQNWKERKVDGIVAATDGSILLSTLPAELTRLLASDLGQEFIEVKVDGRELFGDVDAVEPWHWRVVTVITDHGYDVTGRALPLLFPLFGVGPVVLLVALFFILRSQVQQPVVGLITGMGQEMPVGKSGVREFDQIGEAYNQNLTKISERTQELTEQLARRKQAEEQIRKQEERIRLLLNSTAEGIYGVDKMGICTFCNPACCRLLGYEEADLLGQNIHTLIHHTDANGKRITEEDCLIFHAYRYGQETHAEDEIFWRADGSSFAVEYWSHPLIEHGTIQGSVAAFIDISKRKHAENELRTAWRNWQTTFNATTDMMALLDADGVIQQCNQAFAAFCGREVKELLGQPCFHAVHHTDSHISGCPFVRSRQSLHREEMELTVEDSTYIVMIDPIVNDDGQFTGAVHTMHDISERKRMEEAVIAERNKLEAIITSMGDGVSIQDRNFRVLYQNDVHKEMIGSHEGDICYQAYEHSEHICPGCPVALAMTDGNVHTAERCVQFPSGARYFEINASALRDGTGAIVGGIELVRDVTERKRSEAQLIQAQKMEGIGHLAGGVAHDFNNVLSVVQGYADLLRLKRPDDKEVKECLDQIRGAVLRGSTITRQILAFSRKETMTAQPTDLNLLIDALQKMLRRLVREDIDIQVKTERQPLMVSVDPGQIDQVLINLTTNAAHAMPNGGSFVLETRRVDISEEFIQTHGFDEPGPYAVITATDTGLGMTDEVRQQIFDPFFTTKEVGKGTGLGLSMAYGIIKKHHGYIDVESRPYQGTTFTIYLPLLTEAAAKQPGMPAAEATISQGGNETILVAEDDPSLRLWFKAWLSRAGYTVIEAADGEEAVQKFIEHEESINMLMFDGIMPKKNGKEALIEIRKRKPGIKAMIVSGYAEDIFTHSELVDLKVTFVEKPVEPNQLMQTIRQVLG